MAVPARFPVSASLFCAVLAGCAGYAAQPLPERPALAPSVAALDRTRPGAPPIPADAALTPAEVARLAVQNSPDLRAARAQSGVARGQVLQAGLLPDPVLSGSYNFLLGGPGNANAIGTTLTAELTSLVTRPARLRSARDVALQVDAGIVWQEWQTMSRAQTLAIDLVQQGRLIRSFGQTLDVLAQEERWQALDALLGLQPQVRPLLADTLDVVSISPDEAARMLADLPRRRPDLIALQLGYQSQEEALRAAVIGQFPALTLGPNYGSDTTRVQSFGPSVSIALPLFNRNRGNIAIARATREQLRAEYEARLDAADGGARALLDNLLVLDRQLAAARAGLGQAEGLAANAERALRAGLIDELSYVQLVTARLEKERQVIGLEQQVLDTRVALATLLGAGLPPVRLAPPAAPGLI